MEKSAVSFSGHRPERLPRGEELNNLKRKLYAAVDKAANEGYTTFYQGGCIGFDLLCAMAVIIRRKRKKPTDKGDIRLITVVPYKNQARAWRETDKRLYKEILSLSDEVVILNEEYRTGCFHQRNRYMIDRSKRLICYHDGGFGGTGYTVNYAREKGLEIENIYLKSE